MSRNSLTPECFACGNFTGLKPDIGWVCKAFEDGIPISVIASQQDHRRPIKGDHGIMFEPKIATDPPTSEVQRRAMFAAAAGHSTLDIPANVGREFAEADKGGALPTTAKDMTRTGWRRIYEGLTEIAKFFGEEEKEPEHQGGDDKPPVGRAASVAFVTKDGRILLVRRAKDEKNFPGHWAFPGGQVEEGESFEDGARRECKEEIGDCTFDGIKELDKKRTEHGWDHVTYVVPVAEPFDPKLNDEHDDYAWAPVTAMPDPMHPAVKKTVEDTINGKLTKQERAAASSHVEHRADMPDTAFLEPTEKKYPVKVKRDDAWHYDRDLLLAAAREARMHGHEALADRADEIRKKEFEGAADMALDYNAMDFRGAVILVTKERSGIAFDQASVRQKDNDGRLHISMAHISKANVCPYYGKEIPDFQRLGLDPNRKYMLLRDPDELAKAAPTFNNLPILSTHMPVTSTSFPKDILIGTTGSDASFDGLYLNNDLTFWTQQGIDDVESGKKKELSSGYRYRADMRPGVFKGIPYDGVMRDIYGNHLAAIFEGRVGSDVVVGDESVSSTKGVRSMSKLTPASARAVVTALKKRGLLAMDASAEEAAKLVADMEGLEDDGAEDEVDPNSGLPSYMEKEKDKAGEAEDSLETEEERREIEDGDRRAKDARGRLGRDETEAECEAREERERAEDARARLGRDETPEEVGDRKARMGKDRGFRAARDAHRTARDRRAKAADEVRMRHGDMRKAEDAMRNVNAADRKAAEDKHKGAMDALRMSRDALRRAHDECVAARDSRRRAADARRMSRDEGPKGMTRGEVEDALRARDAKHAGAMDAAIAAERSRSSKTAEALRIVRPVVGELALDTALVTADDVYAASLKVLGVKTEGVHASAFPTMFKMAAQGKERQRSPRYAHDAALSGDVPAFDKMYPGADRISAI